MRMLIGILVFSMAIIMFIAIAPAIEGLFLDTQGCQSFNCPGYTDTDAAAGNACSATNGTYTSGMATNTLGCTVSGLGTPLLILGILIAIIIGVMYGRKEQEVVPDYY